LSFSDLEKLPQHSQITRLQMRRGAAEGHREVDGRAFLRFAKSVGARLRFLCRFVASDAM